METIGMEKAIREVRLDDSPDSPVFTLDLTDRGALRSIEIMSKSRRTFERHAAAFARGEITDEVIDGLAECTETAVEACFGKGSYARIIEYVSGGAEIDPREMTLVMSKLAAWLFERIENVLGIKRDEAVKKYLGDDAAVV